MSPFVEASTLPVVPLNEWFRYFGYVVMYGLAPILIIWSAYKLIKNGREPWENLWKD